MLNDFQIRNTIQQEPYKTLLNNIQQERDLLYIGFGGSISYGTNKEDSDIDIRGITLKTEQELLGSKKYEQYTDSETDTTLYVLDKFIGLALNCNPNIIEMLGTKKEHSLVVNPIFDLLLDNKDIFLSELAINSFGGYATSQLRRLENFLGRTNTQAEKEKHILKTLTNMQLHLMTHYESYSPSELKLYIDKSNRENFDTEIYLDIDLQHYPLRDFHNVNSEMLSAVNAYDKLGKRNNKKTHSQLNKHMMHLIRLYMMLIDILTKKEIITFREKEQGILMNIRNGLYSINNYEPFYNLMNEYEKEVEYAKKWSIAPQKPDYKKAEEILIEINRTVIK